VNKERTEGPSAPTPEGILPEADEQMPLKRWLAKWLGLGEQLMKDKLQQWLEGPKAAQEKPEALWAYEQVGIGPVIAAGLAAHIDVQKAPTVSALWKFAGQAPGFDRRLKGSKLPYNARLKTLCWKLGDSFVKVSGKENAFYGKLYTQFKTDEVSRNENGQYAAAAARELAAKKFKADTVTRKALEQGKLPDAHLHARAKRRTVKVFLSHYWLKGRQARGLPVTDPYIFTVGGHSKEHQIREPTAARNPRH
jgi:hypothetical protein